MHWNADDCRDEALQGDAHGGMFSRDGRERTRRTLDHVLAVLNDLGNSAELVVEQLAGGRDPRANTSRGPACAKQFVGKSRPRLAEHGFELRGGNAGRENANELAQNRNIGLREELLNFWRQPVHLRRTGCAGTAADLVNHTVALHEGDLRADRIRRDAKPLSEIIDCQRAALKRRHDASPARIEQLVSQHSIRRPLRAYTDLPHEQYADSDTTVANCTPLFLRKQARVLLRYDS